MNIVKKNLIILSSSLVVLILVISSIFYFVIKNNKDISVNIMGIEEEVIISETIILEEEIPEFKYINIHIVNSEEWIVNNENISTVTVIPAKSGISGNEKQNTVQENENEELKNTSSLEIIEYWYEVDDSVNSNSVIESESQTTQKLEENNEKIILNKSLKKSEKSLSKKTLSKELSATLKGTAMPKKLSKEEQIKVNKILANNKKYLKENGSRSYRNNNPWNLRYRNQIGSIGKDDNGFAIFPTYEAGRLAHVRQIQLDSARGLSVGEFVKKYAPRAENDSYSYADSIIKRFANVNSDTSIANLDKEKLQKVMQWIEWWVAPKNPIKQKVEIKITMETSWCGIFEDLKERMKCLRKAKAI